MALTTKLEAVNEVLAGIGESPVSSLSSGFTTASTAEQKLNSVSKAVQETGWFFNTETELELLPDSNGNIYLPSNTLRADEHEKGGTLVQRGLRLYDNKKHSYRFTQPVKIDVVVELPWDELPQAAREYIQYRTKRLFQADYMGEINLMKAQSEEEAAALYRLKQADSESGDFNIFDNYDLAFWHQRGA